ncbi:MAG: trypsin-like peptidase domain-containing protein [Bacteroidota bacterium]
MASPKLLLWSLTVFVAVITASTSAAGQPSPFQLASQQFSQLNMAARYELQMLLIAAGYSTSVSTDDYNTRIFQAVWDFQGENAFPQTGSLDRTQLDKLQALAAPVLRMWALKPVRHPMAGLTLWVPSGLGLAEQKTSNGFEYSLPDNALRITFDHYTVFDIKRSYEGAIRSFAARSMALRYQVLRPDFFVIAAETPSTNVYMRFHRSGTSGTGFELTWRTGETFFPVRLTTIMSDLFRSAAAGLYRTPPQLLDARTSSADAASPKAPSNSTAPRSKDDGAAGGTGTGFFVSNTGHILTNAHVVERCSKIEVKRTGDVHTTADVVARDEINDLALLKTSLQGQAPPPFRAGVKVGETVATYGFPLSGLLATTGNFTIGNISATAGLLDDTRMLQVSSPVQPGNSGGPLLDEAGNVVGVVVGKLNAIALASVTKDVAQNVNFAIKASIAINFLEANGMSPETNVKTSPLPSADLAHLARSFTVAIECLPQAQALQ